VPFRSLALRGPIATFARGPRGPGGRHCPRADLALGDNDHPALVVLNSTTTSTAMRDRQMNGTTQGAMQLVRLGANPTRRLNLSRARDSALKQIFRMAGMDGKSALELAKMTKRTELVELMEQHLRYSVEERARVVHCRCGSRLPWTSLRRTTVSCPLLKVRMLLFRHGHATPRLATPRRAAVAAAARRPPADVRVACRSCHKTTIHR
jgi:hypothetical protein